MMKQLWIRLVAMLPLGDTSIVIADGVAKARRGETRAVLLAELTELAKLTGIDDACIHAARTGSSGFKLSLFGIPPKLHQRFRNVWGMNWK